MTQTTVLDVKGLNCPQPLLKAKKALGDLPLGGRLEVHATDPGSVADFAAFCRKTGNVLVAQREDGGVHVSIIQRGPR
jgi:tRNA 2-thiouridine synthesizing protein A